MNRFIISLIFILVPAVFASSKASATEAMNAEFKTLGECLAGIKASSGKTLKIITDTPSEVSGFLSDGQGFACEKKVSGTKGVYYAGWYMVE